MHIVLFGRKCIYHLELSGCFSIKNLAARIWLHVLDSLALNLQYLCEKKAFNIILKRENMFIKISNYMKVSTGVLSLSKPND